MDGGRRWAARRHSVRASELEVPGRRNEAEDTTNEFTTCHFHRDAAAARESQMVRAHAEGTGGTGQVHSESLAGALAGVRLREELGRMMEKDGERMEREKYRRAVVMIKRREGRQASFQPSR